MKSLKFYILLVLPLIVLTSFGQVNAQKQKKAKDYIKLYTEHVGGTAWNWIAENKSDSKAIKFTIQYSQGGAIRKRWTKVFTLEPGDFKHVGRQRDQHTTTINAYVKGARYVRH